MDRNSRLESGGRMRPVSHYVLAPASEDRKARMKLFSLRAHSFLSRPILCRPVRRVSGRAVKFPHSNDPLTSPGRRIVIYAQNLTPAAAAAAELFPLSLPSYSCLHRRRFLPHTLIELLARQTGR